MQPFGRMRVLIIDKPTENKIAAQYTDHKKRFKKTHQADMFFLRSSDKPDNAIHAHFGNAETKARERKQQPDRHKRINQWQCKTAQSQNRQRYEHRLSVTDPGKKRSNKKRSNGNADVFKPIEVARLRGRSLKITLHLQNHRPYAIEQDSKNEIIDKNRNAYFPVVAHNYKQAFVNARTKFLIKSKK